MMLKVFIILLSCICVSCGLQEDLSSNYVKRDFNGISLNIPNQYVLPDLPSSITGTSGDLGIGMEASLKIPLSDISFHVNRDKGLSGNVVVFLMPLSQGDVQISKDAQNAWDGVGLYDNRIIKYDNFANLYRVYPKSGYPKLWNYFKSKPDGNILDPESVVASCMVGPLDQEAADLSNVMCKTISTYKSIKIELNYSGEYILELHSLTLKLKTQLTKWED